MSLKVTARAASIVLVAAALAACAGLPLPDAPEESLVILPVEFGSHGEGVSTSLRFVGAAESPGKLTKLVPVAPDQPFAAVVLPAGRQLLTGVRFLVDKGRDGVFEKEAPLSEWIPVAGTSVIIYNRCLVCRQNDGPRFTALTAEKRAEVAALVLKDRMWPAWEGCALVNFPEPADAPQATTDAARDSLLQKSAIAAASSRSSEEAKVVVPRPDKKSAAQFASAFIPEDLPTGSYLEVPAGSSLDLAGAEVTIEAWIRLPEKDQAGQRWIVCRNKSYGLFVDRDMPETFGMMLLADEFSQFSAVTHLEADTWHHLACTYDGWIAQLFLDGMLQVQIPVKGDVQASNSNELWIGGGPFDTPGTFAGAIDEVRIWSVARSEQDIRQTMNRPLKGNEPGLAAYYQFTHDAEGVDSSMNGNDGTFVGSADFAGWF